MTFAAHEPGDYRQGAVRRRAVQNEFPEHLRDQFATLLTFLNRRERRRWAMKAARLLGLSYGSVISFITNQPGAARPTRCTLRTLTKLAGYFGFELRLAPINKEIVDTLVMRCPSALRTGPQNWILFSTVAGDRQCTPALSKVRNVLMHNPSDFFAMKAFQESLARICWPFDTPLPPLNLSPPQSERAGTSQRLSVVRSQDDAAALAALASDTGVTSIRVVAVVRLSRIATRSLRNSRPTIIEKPVKDL